MELRVFVRGDWDRVIAAGPQSPTPAMETLYLAGELGLEVSHELRKVFGVIWGHQEMEVVGGEREGVDWHGESALGAAERAEDERVEPGSGKQ